MMEAVHMVAMIFTFVMGFIALVNAFFTLPNFLPWFFVFVWIAVLTAGGV